MSECQDCQRIAAALVGVVRACVASNYADSQQEVIALHEAMEALKPVPQARKKIQRVLREFDRENEGRMKLIVEATSAIEQHLEQRQP
jgi:hypothetical protein